MWNTWIDKGKELAEHAKLAAAQIEGQINDSVGTPVGGGSAPNSGQSPPFVAAGGGQGGVPLFAIDDSYALSPASPSAFDADLAFDDDDDDGDGDGGYNDGKDEASNAMMRRAQKRLSAERRKAGLSNPFEAEEESDDAIKPVGDLDKGAAAEIKEEDIFQAAGLSPSTSSAAVAATPEKSPPSSASIPLRQSLWTAVAETAALATSHRTTDETPVSPERASGEGEASEALPPASTSPEVTLSGLAATAAVVAVTEVEVEGGGAGWDGDDDLDVEGVKDVDFEDVEDVDLDYGDGLYDDNNGSDNAEDRGEEEESAAIAENLESNGRPSTSAAPVSQPLMPEAASPTRSPASPADPASVGQVTEVTRSSTMPPESPDRLDPPPPVLPPPRAAAAAAIEPSSPPAGPTAAASVSSVDESTVLCLQDENTTALKEEHDRTASTLRSQLSDLQRQLSVREDQLTSKAEQLTSMQEIHEAEKDELWIKVRDTKEEAKKRILRSKERFGEVQTRLDAAEKRAVAVGMDGGGKDNVINQLREEGQKLAMKQSVMEGRVREARGEARELAEDLEIERSGRNKAEAKAAELEAQVKSISEELAFARKGETKAGKLVADLAATNEDSERKGGQILGLEQEVKELKAAKRELKKAIDDLQKEATAENKRAAEESRRDRDDLLSDLEGKLRTLEREAAIREDALRHEVGELRKRWHDAVRRADEISVDAQQSSAPLMRQLESTERQTRARAAAWAELEMKLRSDLEERVMDVENLTKERNELKVLVTRLERAGAKREKEFGLAQDTMERLNTVVDELEAKIADLEDEGKKIKEEWVEVERRATEGVTNVRTEMMQTVLNSEERYQVQIQLLQRDLQEEKGKRTQLERQLGNLAETSGIIAQTTSVGDSINGSYSFHASSSSKPKKLKYATDQADILQSTLVGLADDNSDDEVGEEDDPYAADVASGESGPSSGSFAAMEQLSQGLRGARVELDALRSRLASSEETREALVLELATARAATEKLPLFEARVTELTRDVEEKSFEILGLREDIHEVRLMYRGQLDALLEEKAMNTPMQVKEKNTNDSGPTGYGPVDEENA